MYTLTLTLAERKAIDWVDYRYSCGMDFRKLLCKCENDFVETIDNEFPWEHNGNVTYTIPEHIAWQIVECLDDDMPFSKEFIDKLYVFIESIV